MTFLIDIEMNGAIVRFRRIHATCLEGCKMGDWGAVKRSTGEVREVDGKRRGVVKRRLENVCWGGRERWALSV